MTTERHSALITGGAGFLGRHFADVLDGRDWSVTTVDVKPERRAWDPTGMRQHIIDDCREFFRYSSSQYDLVIHCAATNPHRRAIDAEYMNLVNDVNIDSAMFKWAVQTQQRHVLYISSSAVYPVQLQSTTGKWLRERDQAFGTRVIGAPDANYGMTKLIGERMARMANRSGVNVTVVRPFSGYGSDQSVNFPFAAFIQRALTHADPFTVWGDADQVRDWIHVNDIVEGALTLVERSIFTPINLCTGSGTSMRDLVRMICSLLPEPYEPTIVTDTDKPMGVKYRVGSPFALTNYYSPRVSLETGIKMAIASRIKS